MTSVQYKKELLYRKANGKKVIESYLSKINSLIYCDIIDLFFIPLECTDDILKKSLVDEENSVKRKIEPQLLSEFIGKIKNYDSGYYVFIDDDWQYCGTFIIPSLNMLKEDFVFGGKIINNILLISESFTKYIDLDYYEINGKYYLDVTESMA
ncbi:hypothetical protein [Winslowiella iniecta]|uniref:Uncharacterized protein n=1 Tax=Winslowiella iniecta TaxID=1560201 RepID=A0A0L7SVQ2_9GAMM|nr:hypothetical protein [Winslowiella iniecta]KOC86663.1 hypothetical protein NG42_21605 [Winslowiella iniecta]KOC87232.1 hypothetical protein NG43_21580 [Winslowiella iniecta]KOC87675.1 hypothetical protein NG42_19330 [Winslowiella iniecta]